MPKSDDTPACLRPYIAHGVDLQPTSNPDEVCGACPFCGDGRRKFYVGVKDIDKEHFAGGWSCRLCGAGGNIMGFLRKLWEDSVRGTTESDYASLEKNRGVPAEHLRMYGLCKGLLTGEWLAPGYGVNGSIVNLYRWKAVEKGKRALMATPGVGLHPGYFRPVEMSPHYDTVEVVEGVWDAAAWRWALSDTPRLPTTLVIAAPGTNIWSEGWCGLGAGKIVTVNYDNDHPRVNPKTKTANLPGFSGTKRVAGFFGRYTDPPKELRCLWWGDGVDGLVGYDPTLPDGYDLRDVVRTHNGTSVKFVEDRVRPVPVEWVGGSSTSAVGSGQFLSKNQPLHSLPCTSWTDLTTAWKKALHYTTDFEKGLIFALCVASAVNYGENRLWGKLVGVGGCGKSTICEGISIASRHVVTESIITSMYSGTKTDDGKDHSFVARLRDMCWVNNDADTLLTNGARETILAQLRDLYGGKGSKAFGNGIGSRTYHNLKFTVILAGTHNLCELDSADLGGRFVDFVFEEPGIEVQKQMAMIAMMRQMGGFDGLSPELKTASRMTGGYVEYLRSVVDKGVTIKLTPAQLDRLFYLAKYTAKMRARPPRTQDEIASTDEMPTRLSTQLLSVAVLSAIVRGRDKIDIGSMDLVRRVALDTSRGRTAEVVRAVSDSGKKGIDLPGITGITKKNMDTEERMIKYLVDIHVLESFDYGAPSLVRRVRYRLSPEFRGIYHAVFPQTHTGE